MMLGHGTRKDAIKHAGGEGIMCALCCILFCGMPLYVATAYPGWWFVLGAAIACLSGWSIGCVIGAVKWRQKELSDMQEEISSLNDRLSDLDEGAENDRSPSKTGPEGAPDDQLIRDFYTAIQNGERLEWLSIEKRILSEMSQVQILPPQPVISIA